MRPAQIDLLDGLQNILPYGATNALQTSLSSLLHAYKRNELDPQTGLGIFTLSATLTDQAEPSESLMATVAWQIGLESDRYLLSSDQLDAFRYGSEIQREYGSARQSGLLFCRRLHSLCRPGRDHQWHIVADVNQDSAAVVRLREFLTSGSQRSSNAKSKPILPSSSDQLLRYVAAADGLQLSAQETTSAHHFANTLFNIMRGGIFAPATR